MVDGKGKSDEDVRLGTGPHDEFLELCAVSTSGSLSEEEQKKLRTHLAVCTECREAMKQFEGVVDRTIPALATELAKDTPEEDSAFSPEAAEAAFRERLSEENKRSQSHLGDAEPWLSPLVVRQSRNFRRKFENYYFWLPLTAVLLLSTSLSILAYRIGKHRGVEVGRFEQGSAPLAPASSPQALEIASRDRDAANTQLAERDKAIAGLRREIEQESSENAKLKALLLEQEFALQSSDAEKKRLTAERDRMAQRQRPAGTRYKRNSKAWSRNARRTSSTRQVLRPE